VFFTYPLRFTQSSNLLKSLVFRNITWKKSRNQATTKICRKSCFWTDLSRHTGVLGQSRVCAILPKLIMTWTYCIKTSHRGVLISSFVIFGVMKKMSRKVCHSQKQDENWEPPGKHQVAAITVLQEYVMVKCFSTCYSHRSSNS